MKPESDKDKTSKAHCLVTATLAVSETAPQGTLLKPDDKRQAERLPC